MCLQNLPVEFDAQGRAHLKGGIPDPWSIESARPQVGETDADREERIARLATQNGRIRSINMDPVTRVAGELGIYVTVDLEERRFLDARTQAPLFRGYEVLAMGRDPRDAIFITSRVCGVCGGVHSHAAAYALEMAMGIPAPPFGTVVRNLGETAEMLLDNSLHMCCLAGPDYSELVVKATTPQLWEKAKAWRCPSVGEHGFTTMAELMESLNPMTGTTYRKGLHVSRIGKEMFSLLHGKYPHPQTIVPGGVSSTITFQTLNEYHARLTRTFDDLRSFIGIYDDLAAFFYEADDRYKDVGKLPMNFIETGYWDHPEAYDGTYENCNEWGEKRWCTPGVVIDGELVTTRLTDLNIGIEEFVDHSFYEQWSDARFDTDPSGNPISPFHPWNKRTLPKPEAKNWKEKYTWACAPRWDRQVMEAGCYARLFTTGMARKHPHSDFFEATGHGMRLRVPKSEKPEKVFEWRKPEVWNCFERNRGRAYHLMYAMLVSMQSLMDAYQCYNDGDLRVAQVNAEDLDKVIPDEESRGVGFWGAGRGYLTHHCVIEGGKLTNYQVITPSAWNASPRDAFGQPGPYEQLTLNTPILEEFSDPKEFTAIDMMRGVRSLDPCMPCTVHADTGHGTVVRDVNTCGCDG
jgi:hydrogenase large subunit